MGEKLERALQRQFLYFLQDAYPKAVLLQGHERFDGSMSDVLVNAHYLHELGLIDANFVNFMSGDMQVTSARITAQGMDFLADDGGLGAILGVVTVKLHDDTIRDLLLARVDSADDLDEPAKKKLKDTIKGLPAEALKTFTVEGLKIGLNHLPEVGHWLAHMAQNLM